MNDSSKRGAIYARVSSEKQDIDLSISAQLKALREYATRNGHVITREYVDGFRIFQNAVEWAKNL